MGVPAANNRDFTGNCRATGLRRQAGFLHHAPFFHASNRPALPYAHRTTHCRRVRYNPARFLAAVQQPTIGATVLPSCPLPEGSHRRPDDTQLRNLEERPAICANWKNAAPRRSRASTNRASSTRPLRDAIENAETKQRLEDLLSPSSRSAAPRPRSPAKPASRRWPTPCWPTRTLTPETEAASYINAEAGFADTKARCSTAPARFDGTIC